MGTTIKDVARAANISITAVSQVLNDRPCRISQEKRELILRTAKSMNYHPNRNAVALATNCTQVIAVILNDISNAYFAEFAKGAEDTASGYGYQLLMVNVTNRQDKPKDFEKLLGYDTTDGLILTRDLDIPELAHYINGYYNERKKPVVNAGNGEMMFPSGNVIFENEKGAYIATKHMIGRGHRRIGCIAGPKLTPFSRLRGYRRALEEAGIAYDESLVKAGDYHVDIAREYARELYMSGATGIFCFNDLMAYGVYQMADKAKLRIGKDLSVVGFDDLEFSALLSTPLTSVRQPAYEMGAASCRMLVDMIQNDRREAEDVYFQPELIIRESTGSAGEDERADQK